MESRIKWVALGYSIPINPSRNRVYIWRKLKEFGAEYFKQGVAVLPQNKTNIARFNRLAQRIIEMGGEAQLVEMRFLNPSDESELISRFRQQTEDEYTALLHDCADLLTQIRIHAGQKLSEYEADQLKKVVRRYAAAKNRDYFRSSTAGELEEKLYGAIDSFRASASELHNQISRILDKLGV